MTERRAGMQRIEDMLAAQGKIIVDQNTQIKELHKYVVGTPEHPGVINKNTEQDARLDGFDKSLGRLWKMTGGVVVAVAGFIFKKVFVP